MSNSVTSICNMALSRIGASRIEDYENEASIEAIQCRLHYPQTRDALLRSHFWRFAKSRATLSQDGDTPEFQWDYQYALPNDFLRMISVYTDSNEVAGSTIETYELEGKMLLSNEETIEIRYIRKVTDPTEFDSLFVEILYLWLALKLIIPLAQDFKGRQDIVKDLGPLYAATRAMDRSETNTIGRVDLSTWVDARLTNDTRIPSKMG